MQVGEDLRNHRGVDDRGDDLQAATTVWAVHEFQRRQHDMGGAVTLGILELQHDLTGWIALEPFVGNGRAGDIAAQAFELLALVCTTAHCGV